MDIKKLKYDIAMVYLNLYACYRDAKECNDEGDVEGAKKEMEIAASYEKEYKCIQKFILNYFADDDFLVSLMQGMKSAVENGDHKYFENGFLKRKLKEEIDEIKHGK